MLPTRRPPVARSPASSPRALPVVVPLLSPIPWLTKEKEEELESVDDMALAEAASPTSPTRNRVVGLNTARSPESTGEPGHVANSSTTTTPTGGVVDEVDPGSGGSEVVEPVALSSTSVETASSAGARAKSPTELLDTASLRERFVRASSPRVVSPNKNDEGGESEAGGKMEVEAGDRST